jgi:hypothetical protein
MTAETTLATSKSESVVIQVPQGENDNHCYWFLIDGGKDPLGEQRKIKAEVNKEAITYTIDNHTCKDSWYTVYTITRALLWLMQRSKDKQSFNVSYEIIDENPGEIVVDFRTKPINRKNGTSASDSAWITGVGKRNSNMAIALVLPQYLYQQIDINITDVQQYSHNVRYECKPGMFHIIFLEGVVEIEQKQKVNIKRGVEIINLVCDKPKYTVQELQTIRGKAIVREAIEHLSLGKIEIPKEITSLNIITTALEYIKLVISKFEFVSTEVIQFFNQELRQIWRWIETYYPYDMLMLDAKKVEINTALKNIEKQTGEGQYRILLEIPD